MLAQNGACALAEAARDAGEDALLMLDLEQSFKAPKKELLKASERPPEVPRKAFEVKKCEEFALL